MLLENYQSETVLWLIKEQELHLISAYDDTVDVCDLTLALYQRSAAPPSPPCVTWHTCSKFFYPPVAHSYSVLYLFVTAEGCQSASFWLSDSLGLLGRRFCPFWQPGAARVYLICSLTAWGCQGAHNGLCDSLGWQVGDFAFLAKFLILNKIMPPA